MATYVLVLGTFSLLAGYYLKYKLSHRRLEKLIEQFVVYPGYPVLGHILLLCGSITDIFGRFVKFSRTHPSPVGGWLFHKPFVVVYDPENFKIIMNKVLSKGSVFGFIRTVLGSGLVTIDDKEIWKQHRRLMNPAFSYKLMDEHYLSIFTEVNGRLVQELDKLAGSTRSFNLWRFIYQFECQKICRATMDFNIEGDENKHAFMSYARQMTKALTEAVRRVYQPWLYWDMIFALYNRMNGRYRVLNGLRELPRKIIKNKRNRNDELHSTFQNSTANMLINILTSPEASMVYSDKELVDEIATVLDAGSGTTVTSVCFTLLMLAMHQDHQDRVYEEIHKVVGEDNKITESQDLDRLPLLDRCLKETWRIFPPVPIILRQTQEDITLKDSRIIPKGTTVTLSIYHLHRDQTLYPNPEVWDPNRFLPEEVAKRPPYSFVPFSGGPRSCIGEKYALLTIKTQLVMLLHKFKFTTHLKMSDIKLDLHIAIRNLTGYNVYIHRRQEVNQ